MLDCRLLYMCIFLCTVSLGVLMCECAMVPPNFFIKVICSNFRGSYISWMAMQKGYSLFLFLRFAWLSHEMFPKYSRMKICNHCKFHKIYVPQKLSLIIMVLLHLVIISLPHVCVHFVYNQLNY